MTGIRDRHRRLAPAGHPDLFTSADIDALDPANLRAPAIAPVITRSSDSTVEALMIIRDLADAAIEQARRADSGGR